MAWEVAGVSAVSGLIKLRCHDSGADRKGGKMESPERTDDGEDLDSGSATM